MLRQIIAWGWTVVALVGCATTDSIPEVRPKPEAPIRESAQAEGLLGLIYFPKNSTYSLRYSPERDELNQPTSELQKRLTHIRTSKGNIAFSIETCGPQGETLTEKKGILDRENGDFRYGVDEKIYDGQPVMVWLKFLDWHNDQSVISFTEVGSDPFTAEHFVISHGENQFHMTLSAPYLIE